jgi:hypothetical protein
MRHRAKAASAALNNDTQSVPWMRFSMRHHSRQLRVEEMVVVGDEEHISNLLRGEGRGVRKAMSCCLLPTPMMTLRVHSFAGGALAAAQELAAAVFRGRPGLRRDGFELVSSSLRLM